MSSPASNGGFSPVWGSDSQGHSSEPGLRGGTPPLASGRATPSVESLPDAAPSGGIVPDFTPEFIEAERRRYAPFEKDIGFDWPDGEHYAMPITVRPLVKPDKYLAALAEIERLRDGL